MRQCALGIDLGGTNLKGVILDSNGSIRHLTRIPTEASKGGKRVLHNILTLIEKLIAAEGSKQHIIGVGIGTPGFVDQDGTVDGADNLPGWKGTNMYEPILKAHGLNTIGANDVTVAALAESRFGAGKGVNNMVCLALGTGIGGGIVINGKIYAGTHGMAAELGHIIVEPNGIQCTCGLKGCVERYASATGIVSIALDKAKKPSPDTTSELARICREKPETVTAKLVYDYAKRGDTFGILVNEYVCDKLAAVIGMICNTLSPDRIILGGGVMMAGSIILDTTSRYVTKYCFQQIWKKCELVAAQCGEDAGVLGAGAMAFDAFSGK